MHDESYDLWIIDFYHNKSTLLIFVVINLTLSVLNMIHVFIRHKWNKIICFETNEKRKTFLKIILLNLIDFDESICIIFVNLLDFDNDFDDLNLNKFLSKSRSWSLEIYNMKSFMNQDCFLFKRRFVEMFHSLLVFMILIIMFWNFM